MRGQFGPPVARENTFQVEPTYTAHHLPGFEITQVPDMLTDHKGFLAKHFNIMSEYLGLVLLAEHLRLFGMAPGDGVRAEFGQNERLVEKMPRNACELGAGFRSDMIGFPLLASNWLLTYY